MSDNGSKKIELPVSITVRDLAQRMAASPIQVIKILMSNGVMANINQQIDFDTAAIVAAEMGFDAIQETIQAEESNDRIDTGSDIRSLQPRESVRDILGDMEMGKQSVVLKQVTDASLLWHPMDRTSGVEPDLRAEPDGSAVGPVQSCQTT